MAMVELGTIPPHSPLNHVKKPRGRRMHWTLDNPPKRIRDFITWYCLTREYGQTPKHYAELCGVTTSTINNWMNDPRVLELLENALRKTNAGPAKVQEVLDMLHRRATTMDDVKAANVYLQAVDKLIPRRQVDVVLHDARQLSDEQLRTELGRAIALLEKREPDALGAGVIDAEVVEDEALDD